MPLNAVGIFHFTHVAIQRMPVSLTLLVYDAMESMKHWIVRKCDAASDGPDRKGNERIKKNKKQSTNTKRENVQR